MLKLDLMRLGDAKRFQEMCFRLARVAFPHAAPMAFASWDRGSDIVAFQELADRRGKIRGDTIWQCKFTKSLGANTKRAVLESLERFDETYAVRRGSPPVHRALAGSKKKSRQAITRWTANKWILCIPVEATRVFHDWLRPHLAKRRIKWEIWDDVELRLRLEKRPDIVDCYFYEAYAELRRYFATEELQLVRMKLDKRCQWKQSAPKTLFVARSGNVMSPDLVFDIVMRNVGEVDTIVTAIEAEVAESLLDLHGLPGEGLLFPQITYAVSINAGRPGTYVEECDPPLIVRARSLERFKVRLTHTGYSWRGPVRISLQFGVDKKLSLPWWWVAT